MLKIIIIIVFAYNLITTVSNPTVQGWVFMGALGLIGITLFLKISKKILGKVIKVVAVVVLITYILMQLGLI